MKLLTVLTLLAVLATCSTLAAQLQGRHPALSTVADADKPAAPPAEVVGGMNRFGFDLYGRLAAGNTNNLFLSPASISTALAMTYAGARENTATQMAGTLHLPERNVHEGYGALVAYLNAAGQSKAFDLTIANALWGQQGFDFLDDFTGLLNRRYEAGMRLVDYENNHEAARLAINAWIEVQTNDKIKNLIPQGVLDPDTRMVLTNAIYFNGTWESKFDPDATRPMPFTTGEGKRMDTPMMYQKSHFAYAEDAQAQYLEMGYKDSGMAMTVILPRKADGLAEVEKNLTAENLGKWVDAMRRREVQVYLPKFTVTAEFRLAEVLKSMGMTDAFNPRAADFSGMTGRRDLIITEVIHKAFVDVNETGTEAATATGIVMGITAMPMDPPPTFKADRPFVYVIRDTRTGAVLFAGRLSDPKTE